MAIWAEAGLRMLLEGGIRISVRCVRDQRIDTLVRLIMTMKRVA